MQIRDANAAQFWRDVCLVEMKAGNRLAHGSADWALDQYAARFGNSDLISDIEANKAYRAIGDGTE